MTFVILHLNLPAVFHNKYEKHSREICYLSVVSGIMFFFLIFFHLYHLTFKNISGLSVSYFKCSFSWWWKWGDWVNGLREALNRTTDPSPVLRSTSLVSMKLSSSSASAMSWLLLFPYFRAVLSWERWKNTETVKWQRAKERKRNYFPEKKRKKEVNRGEMAMGKFLCEMIASKTKTSLAFTLFHIVSLWNDNVKDRNIGESLTFKLPWSWFHHPPTFQKRRTLVGKSMTKR